MRQIWKATLALALGVGLMAGQVPRAGAATAQDTIQNFSFNPNALTIAVGDSVTWTNKDSVDHTATSDTAGVFDTGAIAPGQSKSVTFTQAGTFTYHCSIHPNMKATLIVQAAASTAAPATNTPLPAGASPTNTPTPPSASPTNTPIPLSASLVGLRAFHLGVAATATGLRWTAFANGKQVPYLVTDASERAQALSMHANFAPSLAREAHSSRMYLVTGPSASGQLAVLASVPGSSGYFPLRREVIVRWKSGKSPLLLTSGTQIESLARRGDVTLTPTHVILNAPVLLQGA